MNAVIGAVVIVYTVTGGSKAVVGQTQKQQMVVIMRGHHRGRSW